MNKKFTQIFLRYYFKKYVKYIIHMETADKMREEILRKIIHNPKIGFNELSLKDTILLLILQYLYNKYEN